jgi:hypothetical protein
MPTYTHEHLQALHEALASGEHRVTYEGKSIEYRSVADLKAAIAEVEATLARESGTRQSRQIRVTTHKAL